MERARELLQTGRLEELEHLIGGLPAAEGLHVQAALHLARKQPQEALASIRHSLQLASSFSQRNTLAVCLLAYGQSEEAQAVLRELLEIQPENADLWFNLARAEGGEAALRRALACRPGWRAAELMLVQRLAEGEHYPEALALLRRQLAGTADQLLEAQLIFRSGRYRDAAQLCLGLLHSEPELVEARRLLFQAVLAAQDFPPDERLADELERGLELPGAYALVASVWRVWPRRRELLLALLRNDLVCDWGLEQWLTRWRRQFRFQPRPDPLAEALAAHNYTNEFCFLESPEEIQDLTPDHPAYSLYRPLPEGGLAEGLVRERHLVEPAREAELRVRFQQLDCADVVTRQYQQSPYPRWRHLEAAGPPRFLHEVAGEAAPRWDELRVLVAGCGTGRHALLCAQRYRNARVWGVDVSATSLAYAQRQSERLGISGVIFQQADLLALEHADLPEYFELIESVGVLHHLVSPLAGLRALLARLLPDGWMRLGLYSRRARQGLEPARRLARELAALPLRELRAELIHRLDSKDLEFLQRFKDFYSLSGLRDLLLHEREQEYDLHGVAELLRAAGLEFQGFDALAAPVLRRFGSSGRLDLARWAAFEEDHPETFMGMYVFWCRRQP